MNKKQRRKLRQIVSFADKLDNQLDQHVNMFFQKRTSLRELAGLPKFCGDFEIKRKENKIAIIKIAEELERICKNANYIA